MQINGSSALVTGGASGLGRATAERLVAGGARRGPPDYPPVGPEGLPRPGAARGETAAADPDDD
ncbi:hypothetical protein ACFV5K_40815, partial [Streptomyces sp. NPDC059744]